MRRQSGNGGRTIEVIVTWKLKISAEFAVPVHYGVGSEFAAYRFGQPFVAAGVSDIRGIESPLRATLNDTPLQLLPGTGTVRLQGGLHALVSSLGPENPAHLQLVIDLPLLGTNELHVVPVGRETQIDLRSNWPHPSFTGDFLPVQREIDAKGFSAHWATSFFATNLEEVLHRCNEQLACAEFTSDRLGVSFLDPLDQYLKTDRAIKYALLFIALTFAGFFLFDVLKRLPVHPIQYGLVGAGLALFSLLLLSLSEHFGFGPASRLTALALAAKWRVKGRKGRDGTRDQSDARRARRPHQGMCRISCCIRRVCGSLRDFSSGAGAACAGCGCGRDDAALSAAHCVSPASRGCVFGAARGRWLLGDGKRGGAILADGRT